LDDGRPRIPDGFPKGIHSSGIAERAKRSGRLLPDVPFRILQARDQGDNRPPVIHTAKRGRGLEANAAARILQQSKEPRDRASVAELPQGHRRMQTDVDAVLPEGGDQVRDDLRIADESECLGRRRPTESIVSGAQGVEEVGDRRPADFGQGADGRVLRPFPTPAPTRLDQCENGSYVPAVSQPLSSAPADLGIRALKPMQEILHAGGTGRARGSLYPPHVAVERTLRLEVPTPHGRPDIKV